MWRIPRPASYIWLPIFGQSLFSGCRNMFSFKNPGWQSEKDVLLLVCFFPSEPKETFIINPS